jgi:hypothetical protein
VIPPMIIQTITETKKAISIALAKRERKFFMIFSIIRF